MVGISEPDLQELPTVCDCTLNKLIRYDLKQKVMNSAKFSYVSGGAVVVWNDIIKMIVKNSSCLKI